MAGLAGVKLPGVPGGKTVGPQFKPNPPRPGMDTPARLAKPPVPLKPFGPAAGAGQHQYGAQRTGPTPGGQPSGGGGLDSTYLANTAANQFKVNQKINELGLQRSEAGTTLQDTLAQLAYQQPRAQLGLEEKANQLGALYSTPYDQQAGDLANQFLGKQAEAQRNYTSLVDKIAAQVGGLEGGVPLYNDQQAAASVGRASNAAAKNPALGAPPVTARPAGPSRLTTAPHRGLVHRIAGKRGPRVRSML